MNELEQRVIAALDEVRGYLQADGGDVEFVEITLDNVVRVKLTGACGSCPFRIMTLKNGVETAVKAAVPEIKSVESV